MSAIDLDRYFARIGYRGARAATLDVLRELHRLHPLAIPFENLDPLAGRRVSLASGDIAAKLVDGRRGGYCFEHNTLFAQALTQLGFRVTPLAARVSWGREPGAPSARTHMLLRVDFDGDGWLADVGFGGVTLCAPLRLSTRAAQPTPFEFARIGEAEEGALNFSMLVSGEWVHVYRFDLMRMEPADYEVANWYTSTSPDSLFTTNLVVCRVLPDARAVLFNDRYTEYDVKNQRVARTIDGADDLAACLRDRFGIALAGIDVAALYARFAGRGASF